jgi:hypothetical protein
MSRNISNQWDIEVEWDIVIKRKILNDQENGARRDIVKDVRYWKETRSYFTAITPPKEISWDFDFLGGNNLACSLTFWHPYL